MTEKQRRLKRSELPAEMTWDLSDLFKSREDFRQENQALFALCKELNIVKKHPFSNGKELFQHLELISNFSERIAQLKTYTRLKIYEDYTNVNNRSDNILADSLFGQFLAIKSSLETRIAFKPKPEIARLVKEEPKLKKYHPFLKRIQEKKPHLLSLDSELALAKLYNLFKSPSKIYEISKSTDLKLSSFLNDKDEILPNSISLYMMNYEQSSSYEIRGRAYQSLVKGLKSYENTYAATLATYIRGQVALAKIRKYKSATHMLLDYQGVNVQIHENQINTTYRELAPHMQRFARLKQKALGLKELRFCDLKASIAPQSELDISYDYAKETIIQSLGILGDEYQSFIRTAFEKRWIDYADNIGKTPEGVCITNYSVHPYIILTMQNSIRSITVLAHELGHAGVSVFRDKELVPLNFVNKLYLREAPSTMNELLVGKYLIDNASSKSLKIVAILHLLKTYYHNFVTHLLEAEFLRRVFNHAENDRPLTAEVFKRIKLAVLKGFWGDAVGIDDDASLTWMRQNHYYGNLRPYIYSAGQTIATNVLLQIEANKAEGVACWIRFLKGLKSSGVDELLNMINIDMTKPEPVKKAIDFIGSLITEVERLFDQA